jgi:hypothetical protein
MQARERIARIRATLNAMDYLIFVQELFSPA